MEISACFLARFFCFLFFLLDILGSRNRVLETKDTRNMREILHMTEQSCRMLAKRLQPSHATLSPPLPPIPAKRFIAWNSAQREWLAQRVVWQECESGTWPLWQVPKKPSDTERERRKVADYVLGMRVRVRASDSVGRQRICKMLQENFALSKGIKNLQQQHQQKSQKTLTTNANAKFYRPAPLPLSHFSILFRSQALLLLGENQLQVTQKHQNCIKCQHITTSRSNNSDNNKSSNNSWQMEARKSL